MTKQKKQKDPNLCSVDDCMNPRRLTSNVCTECYIRLCNEVISDDSKFGKPATITERDTFNAYQKAVNKLPDD